LASLIQNRMTELNAEFRHPTPDYQLSVIFNCKYIDSELLLFLILCGN